MPRANTKLVMPGRLLIESTKSLTPQKSNIFSEQSNKVKVTPQIKTVLSSSSRRSFSSVPQGTPIQNIDSSEEVLVAEFSEIEASSLIITDPTTTLCEKSKKLLSKSTTATNPATMSTPQLCLRELLTLKLTNPSCNIDPTHAKVLECGAGRGNMGRLLNELGF